MNLRCVEACNKKCLLYIINTDWVKRLDIQNNRCIFCGNRLSQFPYSKQMSQSIASYETLSQYNYE